MLWDALPSISLVRAPSSAQNDAPQVPVGVDTLEQDAGASANISFCARAPQEGDACPVRVARARVTLLQRPCGARELVSSCQPKVGICRLALPYAQQRRERREVRPRGPGPGFKTHKAMPSDGEGTQRRSGKRGHRARVHWHEHVRAAARVLPLPTCGQVHTDTQCMLPVRFFERDSTANLTRTNSFFKITKKRDFLSKNAQIAFFEKSIKTPHCPQPRALVIKISLAGGVTPGVSTIP